MSKADGPVPIIVTGTPMLVSILLMNSFASLGICSKEVAFLHAGNNMSNFVTAASVALLIIAARLARSKLNGAERRSLPVPAASSNQPRLIASSFESSSGKGPVPTRVMNDL